MVNRPILVAFLFVFFMDSLLAGSNHGDAADGTQTKITRLEIRGNSGSFDVPGGHLDLTGFQLQLSDVKGGTPELMFYLTNRTPYSWQSLDFVADIQSDCSGTRSSWAIPVSTNVGYVDGVTVNREYRTPISSLAGKTDNCVVKDKALRLLQATTFKYRLDGETGKVTDVQREQLEEQAQKSAEAAAEENSRAAAEEKQRMRLKSKLSEYRAAQAAQRARLAAMCKAVYAQTSDKKLADLTVKETRAVQTCESVGLYVP